MDDDTKPNAFELDYADRENLKRTLEGIFAEVSGWWGKLHGKPLAEWRYNRYGGDGWNEAETGVRINHEKWNGSEFEEIPGALDRWTPVCDGKRDAGGSMERYLDAHWQLTAFVHEMDQTPPSLVAIAVAYGWATRDLGFAGVDALTVIQPSEIELPAEASHPPA